MKEITKLLKSFATQKLKSYPQAKSLIIHKQFQFPKALNLFYRVDNFIDISKSILQEL